MMYLGIDYGQKKIGLATGSDETKIASPYDIIVHPGEEKICEVLHEICEKEGIEKIVIGMPVYEKVDSWKEHVDSFIKQLRDCLTQEVIVVDERYSTQMAHTLMEPLKKEKAQDDKVAATVILQGYFDSLT